MVSYLPAQIANAPRYDTFVSLFKILSKSFPRIKSHMRLGEYGKPVEERELIVWK